MPASSRRLPGLLSVLLLAQLLASCAAPATVLPATLTPAPPVPSATSVPATSTPEPTSLPPLTLPPASTTTAAAATQPAASPTPTARPTLRPTVTPLPEKAFTTLKLVPLVEQGQEAYRIYQRVEMAIETDGSAGNPFDPAQVDLTVTFRGPKGEAMMAPAFWYQEYDVKTLQPVGEPGWRVRFTPASAGEWSAVAALSTPQKRKSAPVRFTVQAAKTMQAAKTVQADKTAHGFVRQGRQDSRYFVFDDGTFYFPVGLNVGWSTGSVLADYTRWLDHLSQNGGNYMRVWMASWSFALEWDDTGLGNYANRLQRAWLLDQVFRLAEERGVYVMLCLVNHGAFSPTVNPEWDNNPYNAALGGPLAKPEEFASNPAAKEFFKRRVRYIAARWAYSPNLAVWEWWNEEHWTPISETELMPWLSEMTAELKKYDPYDHLVSTSFGYGDNNATWALPEIDLAQQHEYSVYDPLQTLPNTLRMIRRTSEGKPVLLGEYGSDANGESAPFNAGGIHLHNGLWAAPFAGYAGTGMYWWWDNYIEPLNLWFQYRGVAAFFEGENLQGMESSSVAVSGEGSGKPPAVAKILQRADRALVWVRAKSYTYEGARYAYSAAKQKGDVPADWKFTLPAQTGLRVTLSGLKDGKYRVVWYSTLEGKMGEEESVVVKDGTLVVEIAELREDLAFKIVEVK